jgi:hypothetical protein
VDEAQVLQPTLLPPEPGTAGVFAVGCLAAQSGRNERGIGLQLVVTFGAENGGHGGYPLRGVVMVGLSDWELAKIEARHQRVDWRVPYGKDIGTTESSCDACSDSTGASTQDEWPCDAARLCEEVRRLRRENARCLAQINESTVAAYTLLSVIEKQEPASDRESERQSG